MFELDRKTIMMDAGTALFTSKGSFGTVLGQARAEMGEYGKVYRKEELPTDNLPLGIEPFDLLLDHSSAWRTRYISCLVEDAGETEGTSPEGEPIRKYAVSFKQGDRTTTFRSIWHLVAALIPFILSMFFSLGGWGILFSAVIAIFTAYAWMLPGKRGAAICNIIKVNLEKGIQTNLVP